jgi:hypothetical protein
LISGSNALVGLGLIQPFEDARPRPWLTPQKRRPAVAGFSACSNTEYRRHKPPCQGHKPPCQDSE